jgi:hypothetical protein
MRYIVGYINISANQVIVNKKVFAVVDPQCNRPGHINGSTSSNANDAITF